MADQTQYSALVVHKLHQMISDDTAELKFAYVKSRTAKSTVLVPDLWRHTSKERPDAAFVYVQRLQIQVENLREYLGSSIKTVCGNLPTGETPALGLFSYRDFAGRVLLKDVHSDAGSLVLVVDIEAIPTVEGDIFIGRLVQWIQKGLGSLKLTLIFLASRTRASVVSSVEDFLSVEAIQLKLFDTESSVTICPTYSNLAAATMDALWSQDDEGDQVGQGGPGPCVIVFDRKPWAVADFMSEVSRQGESHGLRIYYIEPDTDSAFIRKAIGDVRPKIVCVDPRFPVSLPLANVRLVISPRLKSDPAFDPSTSLFADTVAEISVYEWLQHWSWVTKNGRAPFALTPPQDVQDVQEWRRKNAGSNPRTVLGDAIMLCLHVAHVFQSHSARDVPVPALRDLGESHPHLRPELYRRLQNVGCVQRIDGGDGIALTRFGATLMSIMENPAVGAPKSFSALHLLAQVQEDKILEEAGKRLLIRIVASMALHVDMSGLRRGLAGQEPETMSALRAACAGIGWQEAANGTMWLRLGWYQKLKSTGRIPRPGHGSGDEIEIVPGLVKTTVNSAAAVERLVLRLEQRRGLSACVDEIAQTMPSPQDLDRVKEALVLAYLHSLICFPFSPDGAQPAQLVTMDPVHLEEFAHPIPLETLLRLNAGRSGGLFAIYEALHLTEHQTLPQPEHLTLIPRHILRRIETRCGDNIVRLTTSAYPVVPRTVTDPVRT
ncbi:hypothetical protein GGR56DRAFT_698339 [Xylariaceae sp. FL0804]|nr:hypothetical protein GGR56DRAFT_698339 [Xylariaceae sp. FL0804]